jgi:putative ABC transport system permease protein
MKLQRSMGSPPQVFLNFFRWYCHPKMQNYIEGDLMEVYQRRLRAYGKQKADLHFVIDVLLLFRPGIIKPIKGNRNSNNYSMLKNYFKISWRSLVKQKTYSMINIGGFAIGVAACILIAIFIKDELSYDTHYANHQRLYRIVGVVTENGELKRGISFPAPMAEVLKRDFPEVVEAGRFNNSELFGAGNGQVRPADILDDAHEEGFVYFDQSLLNMLQLDFIYGNPSQALSRPNSIVITKRKAEKYFAKENPVGKTLIVNDNKDRPYVIGGVVENFRSTSHIQFDFLIGMTGLEFWKGEQSDWGASNYHTYIMIDEGTDVKSLESKMTKGLLNNYFIPRMIEGGMPMSEVNKFLTEKKAHIELQPLDEIHLFTDFDDSLVHGDIRMVWLFGGIALFILLIAVINFVNLSTAKSANRAKEVGIRKVVGSFRVNIISQFLTESILYSVISVILGTAIALAMIPYFNSISGKAISVPWTAWWFAPTLLGSAILVGIVAGMYPSFYLSSFKPIQVLKGNLTRGTKGSFLRSVLVVFQFTTSIILIIGTIVIYRQMNFILNKKIGFDKEQVMMIQGTNTLRSQVVTFANELRELPQIVEVTTGDYLPVNGSKRNGNSFWNEGKVNIDPELPSQFWRVDDTYLTTLGINLVEGRNFDRKIASDSGAVIINQEMEKGLGGNMIGKRINNYAGLWTVIGVVENFHFESLREEIEPLALVLGQEASVLAVKLKGADMNQSIQAITKLWAKFAPHQPFRYSFLDERYAAMYIDVQRTGKIFTSFSVLAILVACLGLFALSAFMVEQRSKEISVRLVLGASVNRIFQMLTWNFVKLVVIAFLLAAPLGAWLMRSWLEDYTYKTEITWDIFAVTGVTAILIALFTITYQSLRAAWIKPIVNLKNE